MIHWPSAAVPARWTGTRFDLTVDALSWAAALAVGVVLRYDGLTWRRFAGYAAALAVLCAAQWAAGTRLGLYAGRSRRGSFDQVRVLAQVTGLATVVATTVDLFALRLVPVSSTLGAFPVALTVMGYVRYCLRRQADRRPRSRTDGLRKVIVFGAGEGGEQAVHAMVRTPTSPFVPVALLDDDPGKRRVQIAGIKVFGTRDDLPSAIERWAADVVLIAIPGAGTALIQELCDRVEPLGVEVRVLPPVGELFHRPVGVNDIRSVTPADLLGRREADIDVSAVAGYLTGKRVLVTGAGGSIGSELCRQVRRLGPASLVMLDRDESALHALELRLEGQALLEDPCLVVADIRDAQRLQQVFGEHRPEVVFHAAALKHLPLLEMHPCEAVKSNIFGTLNVLRACQVAGVGRFVNISTDKAADPVSVLGYSKRIAERLTAFAAAELTGIGVSVRFGNVLGSRGSVLTSFADQIRRGGPVTVTDPEVTRYFMTVQEAVQLVIQAGAVGLPQQALVLDMGQPVRIADVARRLIVQSGSSAELRFTGLRPGEKLHEQLLGRGEADCRPHHRLITHVHVPPLDPADLDLLDISRLSLTRVEIVKRMRYLAVEPASAPRSPIELGLEAS